MALTQEKIDEITSGETGWRQLPDAPDTDTFQLRGDCPIWVSPELQDLWRKHRICLPSVWWQNLKGGDGTSRWMNQKIARIKDSEFEDKRRAAMADGALYVGWCSATGIAIHQATFNRFNDYQLHPSSLKFNCFWASHNEPYLDTGYKRPTPYTLTWDGTFRDARSCEEQEFKELGGAGKMTFEQVRQYTGRTGRGKVLDKPEFNQMRLWVRTIRKWTGELK